MNKLISVLMVGAVLTGLANGMNVHDENQSHMGFTDEQGSRYYYNTKLEDWQLVTPTNKEKKPKKNGSETKTLKIPNDNDAFIDFLKRIIKKEGELDWMLAQSLFAKSNLKISRESYKSALATAKNEIKNSNRSKLKRCQKSVDVLFDTWRKDVYKLYEYLYKEARASVDY